MRDALSRSPAGTLPVADAPDVPDYLNCVLESQCFEKTPALRTLLLFLWRHREEQISEYAIATEALRRSPLFSAKTDATVRVQISRLRQRLEKFYESEGQSSTQRIVIPLGSHQIYTQDSPPGAVEVRSTYLLARESPSRQSNGRSPVTAALAVLCVVLLLACGALTRQVYLSRSATNGATAQSAPRFWKFFYGNGSATRIVLPIPVFFSFKSGPNSKDGTIMLRDTNLNDFGGGPGSVPVQLLNRAFGAPTLAENYTVSSDTFAAVKLVRYLDASGFKTSVHSSADAVLESLDSENLIAIGTWGTLRPLSPYLSRMTFRLAGHEQAVENLRGSSREPKLISGIAEAEDRIIWPGIIAVLPGQNRHTHLLILAGRHTSALVSFLTCTNGLDQLEQMWRANGSPDFYEVVVKSEMNGSTPVRFWPVILHPHSSGS